MQFLYAVGFTAAIAAVLTALLGFLPGKANRILTVVLVVTLAIFYCSQLVYNAVFGTLYSVSLIDLGGAALTNFWRETLRTILHILPSLLAMLVPVPVAVVAAVKRPGVFPSTLNWHGLSALAAALLVHLAAYGCLYIGGTGFFSAYYLYHSPDTITDHAVERFGLLTTMRLELSAKETSAGEDSFIFAPETMESAPTADLGAAGNAEAETAAPAVEYNVLDIDFDYLNSLTTDAQLIELNQYIQSLTPTNKNAYTGMLADYNLITICAESFSTAAIVPELMPTLYKLSTEGFIFENYYTSYPNVTTDGEYSLNLGLWPDTARGKEVSSFQFSQNNDLPFALGNVFREQAGIAAYAYHNFEGSYYSRNESHPNMGYECRFMDDGMTFTTTWPSSDLEMMEQSIPDYLSADKQFHAYYMTFSGHYRYDQQNPMAKRNYEVVKDLNYSETVKCYLSCNYELEKAMAYLMEELEKAGVADRTAIVLTGDHFPYGLTDQQYSELIGYEIDDFTKFKSSLLFWVGDMEEPIYVDAYMCTNDILPTILNLWGFKFDSRLLAGTDVFSDGAHIAILRDQSFFTEELWFCASSGETVWFTEEVDETTLESSIRKIKNQFSMSAKILNRDYYGYLAEHCEALRAY